MDRANVRRPRTQQLARALPAIGTRRRAGDRHYAPAICFSSFILSPIGTIAVPPSLRPAVLRQASSGPSLLLLHTDAGIPC